MNPNRTPFGRVPTEKPFATPSARLVSKGPTGDRKGATGNKKDQAKLKSAHLSSAQMPAEMSKKRHSDDEGATQGAHKHRRGTPGESKNRDLMETSKAAASCSTYETESSRRVTKSKASTGHLVSSIEIPALMPASSVRSPTHRFPDVRQERQGSPIKGGNQSLYVSQAHRLDPPRALLGPTSLGPEVELLDVEQTPPTSSNPSSDDVPIDRNDMDQDEEFCPRRMDVVSDDDIKSDDMPTESGAELGLGSDKQPTIYPPIYPPVSHPHVIDIELDGSNGQEPYQTYAIYIAKTEYWDINKETIPIGDDQLVDWELKGHKMANRFADLLKAFIKLRRAKMDLFQRVNVRLTGHASGLEKRAVALARKHEATASKCQNLVQDVKQSVI